MKQDETSPSVSMFSVLVVVGIVIGVMVGIFKGAESGVVTGVLICVAAFVLCALTRSVERRQQYIDHLRKQGCTVKELEGDFLLITHPKAPPRKRK